MQRTASLFPHSCSYIFCPTVLTLWLAPPGTMIALVYVLRAIPRYRRVLSPEIGDGADGAGAFLGSSSAAAWSAQGKLGSGSGGAAAAGMSTSSESPLHGSMV